MRPIACSAAEMVFPSGALTTMTPRSRRRLQVDVVDADAGAPDGLELLRGREDVGA